MSSHQWTLCLRFSLHMHKKKSVYSVQMIPCLLAKYWISLAGCSQTHANTGYETVDTDYHHKYMTHLHIHLPTHVGARLLGTKQTSSKGGK